ncbi:MAG: hypothetical protein CM15mP127_09300 [Gammaproteobacteria bacterium]|nr:MAG: hypothetical protein CM15mP127_09300 [Gammaproteobacteria bacterium]
MMEIFLIRIEEQIRIGREIEYEENILNGLAKLGMIPDEIPIRQSERHQIYKDAAQKLIDSDMLTGALFKRNA